ncbi:kinesin motor domain-containing protein [Ditylenchus destructor]|uniref:Kinesin motor domain-containing protein n=1 Tax=Ditylenchus destructor TaxID=166010 RepID=A0AAD4MTJ7_9BILA|nr:kinesin motor domain-containing protein [Ditylenchus destructor]
MTACMWPSESDLKARRKRQNNPGCALPLFPECLKLLLEFSGRSSMFIHLSTGTFDGYNATVVAYGQTGSGKTFTMGTSFESNATTSSQLDKMIGIIPRAAIHLFDGIQAKKEEARAKGLVEPVFEVQVSFIELYNEEILDLLAEEKRYNLKIHEDATNGEIYLKGVTRVQVNSGEEIMRALKNGSLKRSTAETNMNPASSRSHAIFSLLIKQQRVVFAKHRSEWELSAGCGTGGADCEISLCGLGRSERLKGTGVTRERQKEGISINCGLLELGNVISALGGGAGKVMHVHYRDSKLTRLLQDSLGGNRENDRATALYNKMVERLCIADLNRGRISELESDLKRLNQYNSNVSHKNSQLQRENNALKRRLNQYESTGESKRRRDEEARARERECAAAAEQQRKSLQKVAKYLKHQYP